MTSAVIADLDRWGPNPLRPAQEPLSVADAEAYCKTLATSHYENFPVVSLFLPRKLHQHFYNVYAYCRWADDLGDEAGSPERALVLLDWWNAELNRCYAGEATHPVFIALARTIREFELPQQPFADLICAFVQDQTVFQYETTAQLLDYCRRSANPVGRIVLLLCGRSSPTTIEYSDSICTGLQLANFWQDVSRDLEIGRVYLPKEVRKQFGYPDAALQQRETTPEFLQMMQHQVAEARSYLYRGQPLRNEMPGRLRIDIDLFVRGGLLILDAIERIDYRVWDRRPKVKKSQLAFAAMKSLLRYP